MYLKMFDHDMPELERTWLVAIDIDGRLFILQMDLHLAHIFQLKTQKILWGKLVKLWPIRIINRMRLIGDFMQMALTTLEKQLLFIGKASTNNHASKKTPYSLAVDSIDRELNS
jgi:hypothetical protein